ncbi:MAG TPA: ABC transporter transmembrane domain-containing protein, partial [Promineifilum sp.]|nr:ABC transporter transmembrane domain-containing protein [Promineifilum sp.]
MKYVWVQWPRVITVVLSAIVVSSLLSLSFVTVIPLLKVMMGDEGLHGWVDRKLVSHRYGLEFYVPGNVDFMQSDIAHHLLVTEVEDASLGHKAGLAEFDRIIGVGGLLIESPDQQYWSLDLLEELAMAGGERRLTLQVRRTNDAGAVQMQSLSMETGRHPFYLNRLARLMSFVPREQTRDSKTKAVIFIVLGVGVITIGRCAAKFVQEYLAQKTVQVAISDLREDAYAHVLEMPIGYFAGERPSDSVSRIIRDTNVMRKAIKIILGKAIREPLNALFLLLAALWLDWKLTLVFTCGVPFVVGLLVVLGKKMRKATRKSLMVSSEMLGKLQVALASVRVIKVYNQYEYENKRFRTVNRRFLKQVLKMSKVEAATQPIMEVLGMAAGSAALVIG